MYTPKFFKIQDIKEITSFIAENSFGILTLTQNGRPIASHLPFLFEKENEDHFLTGHVAYGNPIWKEFGKIQEALVIFQGPHSYISSSWYTHENVPTWNYQAVHVYGKPEILERDQLIHSLSKMLDKYESHREKPVLWDTLSEELIKTQLAGIVGFKIKIHEIEAAYKLSQNRSELDYSNIITQLSSQHDSGSKRTAEAMKKYKKFT